MRTHTHAHAGSFLQASPLLSAGVLEEARLLSVCLLFLELSVISSSSWGAGRGTADLGPSAAVHHCESVCWATEVINKHTANGGIFGAASGGPAEWMRTWTSRSWFRSRLRSASRLMMLKIPGKIRHVQNTGRHIILCGRQEHMIHFKWQYSWEELHTKSMQT